MFSWFFNPKKQLPATDAQFLILEKLKLLEEMVKTHHNEIFHLQLETKKLEQEIKKMRSSNYFLKNELEHLHNKLDRCIILEPSNKKFIEK